MIRPEKLQNALYALHGVLVRCRAMTYDGTPINDLADILDTAETLPRFIASEDDETEKFRKHIKDVAEKHRCMFVLQYFDEPIPLRW